jgi:phenylalanyl-tRNA synthetase alpha chain
MKEKIQNIRSQIESFSVDSIEALEKFRLTFLSKNGLITTLFDEFKLLPPEEKKTYGKIVNDLKNHTQDTYEKHKKSIESTLDKTLSEAQDLSVPADFSFTGGRHPISIITNRIIGIFNSMGYTTETGPEIEDDWHNFTALNFPPEHPARDMQDTFFIEKNPDIALRTHTSSVQIRVMETQKPPIRSIFPGRVYRNEAITARAHCFFHQIEGLYIDKGVTFADLKQTLLHFARSLFDESTDIRLRPSYFPFTEPSAEMDISCNLCGGKGCSFCKYTGWVEILGCGMVDPNVLLNCGINPDEYSGFAFGLGIERITNLQFSVKDLRSFSENDLRFLKQFQSVIK